MLKADPWKSYKNVAAQTAPPGQLVLMLYEGAIRFLERARAGFESDDPAESNMVVNNNVLRAQEIIRELDLALDLDQGGKLAATMRDLYRYFDEKLFASNLRKEATGVEEVIRHLNELRDAWYQMLHSQSPPPDLPPHASSLQAAA